MSGVLESLAVVDEDLDRRGSSVAEHEHSAAAPLAAPATPAAPPPQTRLRPGDPSVCRVYSTAGVGATHSTNAGVASVGPVDRCAVRIRTRSLSAEGVSRNCRPAPAR